MRNREDHGTHTTADAACYEAQRGRDEWVDDRPTLSELGED